MERDPHLAAEFGAAAPEHFEWQTTAPVVSDHERELVRRAFAPVGRRILDLGCAEGETLVHLGRPSGAVGVDLFPDKLRFAARAVPNSRFVGASALALPFRDGTFDHVLIRDVIHHVDDAARLMSECRRVVSPGGRVDILEPCRWNALIVLHALTNRAERGELRSTRTFLERLAAQSGLRLVSLTHLQPFPLHRLAFHPRVGVPALAKVRWARSAVAVAERVAAAVTPTWASAYMHLRCFAA